MRRDVDVEDPSSLEREDDEHVQDLEGHGWNRKEVDGERPREMIADECHPRLGRSARCPAAPHLAALTLAECIPRPALFYDLKLRAFVVIELKATKFKPEYVGQLG